jgi:uncharacterized membrane protein YfcA
VELLSAALLVGGGLLAGIFNTLAGGGSLFSVPLLVLVGLPGTVANGTNRVGVFAQSVVAAWRFRAEGVSGFRHGASVLLPVAIGSLVGSFTISLVADQTFERLFGVLMIFVLLPILWRPPVAMVGRQLSVTASFLVFLAIGLYGGAFQAGTGLALVLALSYAGYDLVRANSIKVVVNAALTGVAIPVFFAQGKIAWAPALLLASGYAAGGALGARLAVRGGERLIRPVLAVAVLVLAGKMVGAY